MTWTALYLILFFCGMAVSVAGTALILRFVGTRFGVDKSDGFRKQHVHDTSRLGGVAVFRIICCRGRLARSLRRHLP